MAPMLEFRNVSCSAAGLEPLEDLSFTLETGGNAVFFGIEGPGIRTISQLALCLEENYGGQILFNGESIKSLDYLSKLKYRNEVGYLHGDYGLISNMTVEENIALRLEYYSEYSSHRIREITGDLMRDLGIYDLRTARPYELTRSQILRTAYARAVAHDPRLLIVEHAFMDQSPLDIRSFMELLWSRTADAPDRSVLFVTYEPQKFVDFADAFHMLYKGRTVFSGSGADYLKSDNPYLIQYWSVSLQGPMELR